MCRGGGGGVPAVTDGGVAHDLWCLCLLVSFVPLRNDNGRGMDPLLHDSCCSPSWRAIMAVTQEGIRATVI